ncbi:MAG: hypothetical protein KKC66_03300 [Candidatus Omnitrophica bacterium]|nr:hypothetical protein [Candidatus Omnitrophota bacterium]
MYLLVKNFSRGERPWSAVEISTELEIPTRLVRDILFNLTEAGPENLLLKNIQEKY